MAKIALNKSALNKEKRSLKTFNRYLPALELKRQQLMLERRKARQRVLEVREELKAMSDSVGENLPMLAYESVEVDNLVKVTGIELNEQNIVGVSVPILDHVEVEVSAYSFLVKPHWVDNLVVRLKEVVRLRVESLVCEKRYALIDHATRITAQRVNLFSKILIPEAKQNIAKIKIFLSDQDRASVVNAKISKGKLESVG